MPVCGPGRPPCPGPPLSTDEPSTASLAYGAGSTTSAAASPQHTTGVTAARRAGRRLLLAHGTLTGLSRAPAAGEERRRRPGYGDAPRPDSMPPAPAPARSQRSARTTQAATTVTGFHRFTVAVSIAARAPSVK